MLDGLQSIAQTLATAPQDAALRASHVRPHTRRSTPFATSPRPERARMFADKTIGVDDPGMIALQRMVDAV